MRIHFVLLLLLFALTNIELHGQPNCHIEHYSLIDGLPQRTVMDIMQDKKGFMWFSTWDGLCKFDGYNFTTYKTKPGDSIAMGSNRIDKICEDIYGDIWVHSYNKETVRFSPKHEKFTSAFYLNNTPFLTSKIIPMPSGKVWLTSETMGAICIPDSTNSTIYFNIENNKLKGNNINTVFEDSELNSWILTNNGLTKFANEDEECTTFFSESKNQNQKPSFFSAIEFDDEIWFGANNGRIWRYNKKDSKFKALETGISSDILSISQILENKLIILSSNDGFMICDKGKMSIKAYNISNTRSLPTDRLVSCYIDKNKNAWIEVNYFGIVKYDLFQDKTSFYSPLIRPEKGDMFFPPHYFIVEDHSGRIWIHPRGGGFSYYDPDVDKLMPFYNEPGAQDQKFSNMLHDLFLDKQGNLWISTRSDGIEKIVFEDNVFRLNFQNSSKNTMPTTEVRAMLEDKDSNIWISSKDGLIRIFDPNKNYKGILCQNGSIAQNGSPLNGTVYSLLQDKYGDIWVGTKGEGLYRLKPDFSRNGQAYHITQFKNNAADMYSISNNSIYSIHEDSKGRLWIGTYGGGLNQFDRNNNNFINHRNSLAKYPIDIGYQVRTIESDKNGIIYAGTTFGLIAFSSDYDSPDLIDFRVYQRNSQKEDGLSGNDVFDVYMNNAGDIFIASFGGGLCKVIERNAQEYPSKFKVYDTSKGLPSDVVLSLVEDSNGKLWIISEGELTKFDPQKETFEIFNDVSRLIDKEYFSEASPICTHSGEIIIGRTKGLLMFNPEDIVQSDFKPYLAFTKFKIANKDIRLENQIDDVGHIVLSHKENFFSIEFAALDYVNTQNILYTYKLDGFDKEWIYSQKQRIANYTNLSPGEYTFRVKSTNNTGNWIDNEHVLHITVKPSFWQTKWAYLLYSVLFIATLYIVLRSLFVFYRMRDRVKLEHEQTEMKTRFFTDISHEIRTPLTMIVSPIENIIDNEKTHSEIKPQLELVLKNTNRMLTMVNQILDFRKIQKQKLNVTETEIGYFISDICDNFIKAAKEQGIHLMVSNQVGQAKIWIDRDSVEKLVINLVSNAMKYTSKGKSIEVNIFRKDKLIALQVKDEGQGMNKDIQSRLFIRFASFNTDKSKPSTGIGLSIVKEVADKHHAKIVVDSDTDKGSSFTILFQTDIEHFADDENVNITSSYPITKDMEQTFDINEPTIENEIQESDSDSRLSILVVEDDADLRGFIRTILAPHYIVFEAENGKVGYESAVQNLPDFILSDIMMPVSDGIELLKNIRDNNDTSHIPFILLSAKSSIDDKLEGIGWGADDYITKPFNVKLLKAKINTIIQQRERVYKHLTEKGKKPEFSEEKTEEIHRITSQDELFINNIQEEILKNIDNSELIIDDLVATTNISRKVFFKKLKSLTGLAPVEFVREIRIKHAAKLLSSQQYMVKEVCYLVGFSDIRYFSQHFKKMYGLTPGQYKEQHENKNEDS